MNPELLLPSPRRIAATGDELELRESASISYTGPRGQGHRAQARLESTLRDRGMRTLPGDDRRTSEATPFRIGIEEDGSTPPQGYRLAVSPGGVEIFAGDSAGLFYGVVTCGQLLDIAGESHRLAAVEITDAPSFAIRGVLLDVSSNRIPKMTELRRLVDLLSGWKINQLQLAIEHSFAYPGHEEVWKTASPLTGHQLRELDRYCRRRFVELVPGQSCLGNFQRWLAHPRYRRLAEQPEKTPRPNDPALRPLGLCATDPASTELIAELFEHLLPNFQSSLVHVGLGETGELGLGRSAAVVGERGRPAVFLDHLARVHTLAADQGRRILLWADALLEHPEVLSGAPRDVIAVARGYEADHPFAQETARLGAAGLELWVCPGTSSWNSFGGRLRNALLNLANAALAGVDAGAGGYLIADWGDNGHLQPVPASYPGWIAGASFAWNADLAREPLGLELPALLDRHVFADPRCQLGKAIVRLGNAYLDTPARPTNGSVLFPLLVSPGEALDHPRYQKLDEAGLSRVLTRVEEVRRTLAGCTPSGNEQRLVRRELVWIADALAAAARFGRTRLDAGRQLAFAELPHAVRRAFRIDVESLLHVLPELWLARSRSGGLRDSIHLLRRSLPQD